MHHPSSPTRMSAAVDQQAADQLTAALWLLGLTACTAFWTCAGWLAFS